MLSSLVAAYYRCTLERPWVAIAVVTVLLLAAATQVRHFHLDASAESLMLETSEDMRYYRELRARYGSDDFLIVTYSPEAELFSDGTLARLVALRDELAAMERVASVTSILDVPLLDSPRVTFAEVQSGIRTLLDEDTDRDLARQEFRTSPLYRDLLMNQGADTTALLVAMKRDDEAQGLLQRRAELRAMGSLDGAKAAELEHVSTAYARIHARLQDEMAADVAEARAILAGYRDDARIHLGGVPMIAVDMIDFVAGDIRTFGIGVALFIVVLLAVAFRQLRWVVVPSVVCAGVALGMVGFLGAMAWPVTVVSSNFISLVLILTLSLIVHLVVQQRELHMNNPQASSRELMRDTVRNKIKPSFFTAITTVVAFGSMLFAEIRPIMDFGLMMVCAVIFGFVLTFVLFPALVAPLRPGPVPRPGKDVTANVIQGLARFTEARGRLVGALFAVIAVFGVSGVFHLSVENRFIDYFKPSTEIYQGMELIDRELGGTTPLDVVLDASDAYLAFEEEEDDWVDDWDDDWDDLGGDDMLANGDTVDDDSPMGGFWFNSFQLQELEEIRAYLDGLPETGKILSVATSMQLITHLNEGRPLEGLELAVLHRQLPSDLREILFTPYMSSDGNQMRFDIRIIDSAPNLERNELLRQIRTDLLEKFDLAPEQVNLSGMLVLYNGVMQSLLRSQYITMFVVFGAMMIMFGLLFRSIPMAVIGPLPTLVAAVSVLGLMGWVGIPLDIMTMTIAAITIGIGVHDTIHYTDRFSREVKQGADYTQAMHASHGSVGRAMFYTTVIVVAGFSILTLSNFMPTIYFGLLTGASMIFALLSNLMLLPLLLQRLRPFHGPAA